MLENDLDALIVNAEVKFHGGKKRKEWGVKYTRESIRDRVGMGSNRLGWVLSIHQFLIHLK
jgi:hypothetical protein